MEPEVTPNTSVEQKAPKISKFTIVFIGFILMCASFLGYLVYQSNGESKTTNFPEIAEPVPNTAPTSTTVTNTPSAGASTPSSLVPGLNITPNQVAENNSKSSCWTIVDGNVYDITKYVPNHPGGEAEILKICGKDGTALFAKPIEHKEGGASDVLAGFKIGKLAEAIQN
jgi:cytochrome b involved in lipid metabolism